VRQAARIDRKPAMRLGLFNLTTWAGLAPEEIHDDQGLALEGAERVFVCIK
jgi:hypothetical protein